MLPVARELQRRNDLEMQASHQKGYTAINVNTSLTESPETLQVDLDANLNETDRENLQDMSFELPSIVFSK